MTQRVQSPKQPRRYHMVNGDNGWEWWRCTSCPHVWQSSVDPVICPECEADAERAPVRAVRRFQKKDKSTQRRKPMALALAMMVALLAAGCGDEPPPKKSNCYEAGDYSMCPTKVNGDDCTVMEHPSIRTEIKCEEDAMECSAEGAASEVNSSGNICRIKLGDTYCIAVLPDGGKSPRDYKDFTECPTPTKETTNAAPPQER